VTPITKSTILTDQSIDLICELREQLPGVPDNIIVQRALVAFAAMK
jgi:hypothetical protein